MKKSDPVYEEIFDHTKAKKLSQLQNEVLKPGYENVEGVNEVCNEKANLTNGVQTRRPVTPSAPSEDDFNNLARVTAVPNEYGVLRDTLVKIPADIQVQQVKYGVDDVNSDVKGTSNPDIDNTDDELNSAGIEDLKHEDKSNIEYSTAGPVFGLDWQAEQGNTYCQFEDLIPLQKVGSDNFQKQTCSEDIGNIAVVDSDNTHSDRVNPLSLNHPSPTPELIPEPFDEIRVIMESGDNIDLPATETIVCEQGNTDIEHTEEGQRVRLVTETKVADGNGNTQEYTIPMKPVHPEVSNETIESFNSDPNLHVVDSTRKSNFIEDLATYATSNALSVMEDKCKCVLDDVADVNGTSVVNIETGSELCLTPT